MEKHRYHPDLPVVPTAGCGLPILSSLFQDFSVVLQLTEGSLIVFQKPLMYWQVSWTSHDTQSDGTKIKFKWRGKQIR